MSNPYQLPPVNFPTQFGGGTIMDPGIGGSIASALANVLAARQQQVENEHREQQLATQQQQAEALGAYYEGTLGIQNRQEDRLGATAESERRARAQVGGAVRRAIGGRPAVPPGMPTTSAGAPTRQLGNQTQAGAGLITQAFGAPTPSMGTDTSSSAGIFEQLLTGAADSLDPYMRSAVFGGVSDENLPAAVEAVRAAQPKPPEAPELGTSSKEFEYYQRLLRTDPERAAMFKTFYLDPKPGTQITNIQGQGESEFSKKWAEAQVKVLTQGEENARGAIQMTPLLDEAYRLVAPGKAFTGYGANTLLNLARVSGAVGFQPGKDRAADTQTMLKLLREQTLVYLRSRDLGSGTAVSDGDRLFMERQSGADPTLDAATIKRTVRINIGSQLMKAQEAVADLRDQALAYPANATQLNRKAEALERKLAPIRHRYAQMLEAEDASEQDIRSRAGSVPGIKMPGQQ